MCGIVGYTGCGNAPHILLKALAGLEYRGYDSSGISVFTDLGIRTIKAKGRLCELESLINKQETPFVGTCGIGHTRWATHGEPSELNAHPHETTKLSLVHNGIIENYQQIKSKLIGAGYQFISGTDTEVAAKLIDFLYDGDPINTLRRAQEELEGSYAFAILFADHPFEIYATRKGSPLIVAHGENENFVASDVPAVLSYTRTYALLEELEIAVLSHKDIHIYKNDGTIIEPLYLTATWTIEQAQKNGFEHFMLKEIYEQPRVMIDTVRPRIADYMPNFETDGIPDSFWRQFNNISIAACGTAWHAGMVGKNLIEKLARVRTECVIASEFRYSEPIIDRHSLVILISQSGETADTLAALRLAHEHGSTTLAIVNVAGSSIAREADYVIHTHAGPEISVASTKAYSVQISVMYLIAVKLAYAFGKMQAEEVRAFISELIGAIHSINVVLELDGQIKESVKRYEKLSDLFFIGRDLDYTLSLEGSLKLKEISYIHCEAYAAGELKHGTISLITQGVPVVAVATQEFLIPKMVSNIREVVSRGADVMLICKAGVLIDSEVYNTRLDIPALEDMFMPIPGVVALQLIAYHTAVLRGCDVDKPRNLAKSVTVE